MSARLSFSCEVGLWGAGAVWATGDLGADLAGAWLSRGLAVGASDCALSGVEEHSAFFSSAPGFFASISGECNFAGGWSFDLRLSSCSSTSGGVNTTRSSSSSAEQESPDSWEGFMAWSREISAFGDVSSDVEESWGWADVASDVGVGAEMASEGDSVEGGSAWEASSSSWLLPETGFEGTSGDLVLGVGQKSRME